MNRFKRILLIGMVMSLTVGVPGMAQKESHGPDYKQLYEQVVIDRQALETRYQMMISKLQAELAALHEQLEATQAEGQALKAHLQEQEKALQQRRQGKVQTVQLKHAKAEQMAGVLLSTLGHRDMKVAVAPRNTLVIRAADEQWKEILDVVRSLDVASPPPPEAHAEQSATLSINVDLVQATAGSAQKGDLPKQLKVIEKSLISSGMGSFKPFGHLMARTREGGDFRAEGMVYSGLDSALSSFVRFEGAVHKNPGNLSAQIDISATIEVPVTVAAAKSRSDTGQAVTQTRYEDFGLETSTTVPFGDYVVLGAVPARLENADTVLMVLRVTME